MVRHGLHRGESRGGLLEIWVERRFLRATWWTCKARDTPPVYTSTTITSRMRNETPMKHPPLSVWMKVVKVQRYGASSGSDSSRTKVSPWSQKDSQYLETTRTTSWWGRTDCWGNCRSWSIETNIDGDSSPEQTKEDAPNKNDMDDEGKSFPALVPGCTEPHRTCPSLALSSPKEGGLIEITKVITTEIEMDLSRRLFKSRRREWHWNSWEYSRNTRL